MFAVSENICIFVIAKVTYKFREINRFHIQNRDKRGVSWYLFFTELIGLWRVNRNAPLHSFIPLTVNFRPMPKSSKNHSEPNNSTQAVSTIHRFRIRITSHLTKNPKLCANIFGLTNILSIFVVRQTQKIVFQSKSIHIIPQIKRGFFSAYLLENNRYGFVAKQGNSSAYSFLSLTVNF